MAKRGEIDLGDQVRDRVTGYQGIVTGVHEYLQGCRRMTVQPPIDDQGKMREAYFFDEPQLDIQQKSVHTVDDSDSGGPIERATQPR